MGEKIPKAEKTKIFKTVDGILDWLLVGSL